MTVAGCNVGYDRLMMGNNGLVMSDNRLVVGDNGLMMGNYGLMMSDNWLMMSDNRLVMGHDGLVGYNGRTVCGVGRVRSSMAVAVSVARGGMMAGLAVYDGVKAAMFVNGVLNDSGRAIRLDQAVFSLGLVTLPLFVMAFNISCLVVVNLK